jgi:membrane protease YdiL (CAAX protease family)
MTPGIGDYATGGQRPRRVGPWAAGVVLFTIGYVVLLALGGGGAEFAVSGLEVIPFAALALLTYAGVHSRPARGLAWIWLALLTGAVAIVSVSFALDVLQGDDGALSPAARRDLVQVVVGVFFGLVLGWLCGVRGVRSRIARVLPIDPDSFVHTIALVAVVSITAIAYIPVTVLGVPPLLETVGDGGAMDGSLRSDVYGLVWLLPAALIAVGYPFARGLHAALDRLGLVWPSRRQVLFALGGGVVMVIGFTAVDSAIAWLWDALSWPVTDEGSFEELMAYSLTPAGALVIGVTAGLGEEVAVRGVLQPRIGLLLSNLFFTSLHAFQYNFDGLLSVFLAGLVLGWVRMRTNTTTSAILHGFYDFLLIMLVVAGW